MFKQVSKQLLCLLCAVICTCALSSPCMAADISSIEDGVIELRMTNINDAQCAISVKNGTAAASANVGGKRGAEKCKIVLKIQEQQGSRWVTLDSWTVEEDGRNASINGSVDAKSGKTYRAQATVTVWLDGKAESKTITTTGTSLRAAARVPQLWNVGYSRCRRWRKRSATMRACCSASWTGWTMSFLS